jgi:hypothetical protein
LISVSAKVQFYQKLMIADLVGHCPEGVGSRLILCLGGDGLCPVGATTEMAEGQNVLETKGVKRE